MTVDSGDPQAHPDVDPRANANWEERRGWTRPARWARPHPGEVPNGAPREPRRLSRDVTAAGDGGRPGKVTRRDLRILEWIGRFYGVTRDQVQWRFGIEHRSTAYRRLQVLKQHRLLTHRQIFDHAPGVYTATKAGLAMVDSPLAVPRFVESRYLHELDVVDVAIEYQRDGYPIVTEREIRKVDTQVPAKDRTAWLTYAVRVYDGTKVTKHYPDLVVVDGKKLIAVEVEHARKRAKRLRPIIQGYVQSFNISGLQYIVTGRDRAAVVAHVEFLREIAATLEPKQKRQSDDDWDLRPPKPFTSVNVHTRCDDDWGYALEL